MSDGDAEERVDFEFALSEREVAFDLDEALYALDAIDGAAYLFVDRCYVFLVRPADRRVRVRLRTREAANPDALEALGGEFANELLNQVLRRRISESTRTIREYYMARAFFGGESRATIDALLAELDAEEMKEEPLEDLRPVGAEVVSDPVAFSRSLYDPEAIRAAVDAYAELARFEIQELANDVVVRISDPDPDVAHCLANEFGNYALVETVARRAKSAAVPR